MRTAIACLLFMLTAGAGHPVERQNSVSIEGTWRSVLSSPGGELPLALRIAGRGAHLRAVIVNGAEEAPVSGVSSDGSTVTIRFDWYDSAITATLSPDGNSLTGAWTRTGPSGLSHIPFHATRGFQARFLSASAATIDASATPLTDVTGIWKTEFVDSTGVSPARGEFHQDRGSSRVVGTFLTPTGDDRYLEGSYERGVLRLSTFDGAHAFLFQARGSSDGRLSGDYWSRDSYHATWSATRVDDREATLPDGWKDVGLKNDAGHFAFRFSDLDGNSVALSD